MEDEYSYCPLCGINWGDDSKNHKCDLMKLIDKEKPRFYMLDLTNYTSEFLVEIIRWQDMKIRAFNRESPYKFDLGLKSNEDIINKFAKLGANE